LGTAVNPLSGERYDIVRGQYTATVSSIGASLASLTHADRSLTVPFSEDEIRPYFRGATLAPWPNRIANGQYQFHDVVNLLPITEPSRGHALHGLAAWLNFSKIRHGSDHVSLGATIEAQTGYPHRIDVRVTYQLLDEGLNCEIVGTNTGPTVAPYGASTHPYLVAGPSKLDEWTLTIPAASYLETDETLIPTREVLANDPEFGKLDYRSGRKIGRQFIDHAFGRLDRTPDGLATVRILDGNGEGVAMSWDQASPWVQIHTADLPEPLPSRIGLAVEPMTCAPNAFNTGADLQELESGQSSRMSWSIQNLHGNELPRLERSAHKAPKSIPAE